MSELKAKDMNICECEDKFTIEEHGGGEVLYFGRCDHKHGFNLCHVTEKSYNILDILNTRTNDAKLSEALEICADDVDTYACHQRFGISEDEINGMKARHIAQLYIDDVCKQSSEGE